MNGGLLSDPCYGLAGGVAFKMHEWQNDVVIVVTNALVLFVETGKIYLLQKISKPAAHDDFLILTVTGELPFDVELKQFSQFGFGIVGQHGANIAEMEQ
jgi:hypothetical protein